jgi:hypothetical protein
MTDDWRGSVSRTAVLQLAVGKYPVPVGNHAQCSISNEIMKGNFVRDTPRCKTRICFTVSLLSFLRLK